MKTRTATLSSKGQVVLPKDVRERLGVHKGDEIEFILDDTGIHIQPKTAAPNPFLSWIGAAPTGDHTPARWLEDARHAELDARDLALLRAGPGAQVVHLTLPADPDGRP